jgi:hypothetical protein
VITRLTSAAENFEKECKLEKNKDLNSLLKVIRESARVENLNVKELNAAEIGKITNFVKSKSAAFPFLSKLGEIAAALKGDKIGAKKVANSLWNAISDFVESWGKKSDYPHFFVSKLQTYARLVRQRVVLQTTFKADAKVCLNLDGDTIVGNLKDLVANSVDPEFNPNNYTCDKTDKYVIDPLDIEKGGYTITFWIKENLKDLKTPVNVFQGFVNNRLEYSIDLFTKGVGVGHKFKFASWNEEFVSRSTCSDIAFVYVSFGKDCEKYRVFVSARFVGSNSRREFSFTLKPSEVEMIKVKAVGPLVSNVRTYKGFNSTPERENALFVSELTEAKKFEIKNISTQCEKKRDNCEYGTGEECLFCKKGLKLHNQKCIDKCPDGTYTSPTGNSCPPCNKDCSTCFGPQNGQCYTCKNKLVLHQSKCIAECPTGWVANKNDKGILECKRCSEKCNLCFSPKVCQNCEPGTFAGSLPRAWKETRSLLR